MKRELDGFKNVLSWDEKAMIVMTGILTSLAGLVLPLSMLMIFDRVLPNVTRTTLYSIFMIIVAIGIADLLVKMLQKKIINAAGALFEMQVHERMFDSILNSNLHTFFKHSQGHYLECFREVAQLKEFYCGQYIVNIVNTVMAFIVIGVIGIIEPFALIVPFFITLILGIVFHIGDKKNEWVVDQLRPIEADTNTKIIDIIRSVETLKGYAAEPRIENWIRPTLREREDLNFEHNLTSGELQNIASLITQIGLIAQVVVCATFVIQGAFTQGSLAAIVMLMNRFTGPVQQSIEFKSRYRKFKQYEQRVQSVFDMHADDHIEREGRPEHTLTFMVRDMEAPAHVEPTFIRPGEVVCIAGTNGSGKTDLLRDMAGYKRCMTHAVSVNGEAIDTYDTQLWAGQVAYINAESDFVVGTILDNLTCFRPNLNEVAMMVCDTFKIRDEINELDRGFYTPIPDGLEGIVSNKIAASLMIVQAVVNDNQVILIDDLDEISDQEYLDELMLILKSFSRKHTFVIASHNSGVIQGAHKVMHMDPVYEE